MFKNPNISDKNFGEQKYLRKILKISNFEAGWSQGNDGLELPLSDQVCAIPARFPSASESVTLFCRKTSKSLG